MSQPFQNERQSAWLEGIEGAFRHFGGLPLELLLDNAKALVKHHDAATREVEFNDRLHAVAPYWNVRPVACPPYRARTKGKDERGVGYVKHNAIAGRGFMSWGALEAHLATWMREVADVRVHGTAGEAPIARFEREERQALRPLSGRAPFRQLRELGRRVQNDACVDVDTNHYSLPWRLIGAEVTVTVGEDQVRVHHAGIEVACHGRRLGRRERAVDRDHLHGIVPCRPELPGQEVMPHSSAVPSAVELLRPLERLPDWLVIAARLLQLRSRCCFRTRPRRRVPCRPKSGMNSPDYITCSPCGPPPRGWSSAPSSSMTSSRYRAGSAIPASRPTCD